MFVQGLTVEFRFERKSFRTFSHMRFTHKISRISFEEECKLKLKKRKEGRKKNEKERKKDKDKN